jgi:hypothetical protein
MCCAELDYVSSLFNAMLDERKLLGIKIPSTHRWTMDGYRLKSILCFLLVSSLVNAPARCEETEEPLPEPTMEQRIACMPDAFRLCSDQIPDIKLVRACMRANKANLSPRCRATFKR